MVLPVLLDICDNTVRLKRARCAHFLPGQILTNARLNVKGYYRRKNLQYVLAPCNKNKLPARIACKATRAAAESAERDLSRRICNILVVYNS